VVGLKEKGQEKFGQRPRKPGHAEYRKANRQVATVLTGIRKYVGHFKSVTICNILIASTKKVKFSIRI
jgi:hypothetical protein